MLPIMKSIVAGSAANLGLSATMLIQIQDLAAQVPESSAHAIFIVAAILNGGISLSLLIAALSLAFRYGQLTNTVQSSKEAVANLEARTDAAHHRIRTDMTDLAVRTERLKTIVELRERDHEANT